MKRQVQLTIEYVPLGSIQPHPDNARVHTSAELVSDSVDAHGQYKALGVQRSTGNILHGNGTYNVLSSLGFEVAAVTYLDVDDEQAKRILLVDNQTADESEYDEAALVALLHDVEGLAGTGFTDQTAADLAALFSPAMTIDQLADELGTEPDPATFWPVARIPLPPDLYQPWIEKVASHEGDAAEALRSILL